MKKSLGLAVIISIILFVNANNLYSQDKWISFGGGIAKALGDGSEYWNIGFCVNGNYLYLVKDYIMIGGKIAYNRWSLNDDKARSEINSVLYQSFSSFDLRELSGSAQIIEISPTIRVISTKKDNEKTHFFGQIGLGYYFIRQDVKFDYSISGLNYTGNAFIKVRDNRFGINLGGGIRILGDSPHWDCEICPMYNIIFTKGESTKYYTINLNGRLSL